MFQRICLYSMLFWLLASSPVGAGDSAGLDFSAWRRMPIFDRGRRMPLDSFARSVVREICGRPRPTLDPSGIPKTSGSMLLFPGDKPRRFGAAELLFSWLVEPEKWERVPFLVAAQPQLREDLLRLPLRSPQGRRLRHVSPQKLLQADRFFLRLDELRQQQQEARSDGEELKLFGADAKVGELWGAYTLYRLVTFDPAGPADAHTRLFGKLVTIVHTWRELEEELRGWLRPAAGDDPEAGIDEAGEAIEKLVSLAQQDRLTVEDADPALQAVRDAARRLAAETRAACREAFADRSAGVQRRAALNRLAVKTDQLARVADQMHVALYDNGRSLRLVPALDPGALRADRDLDDDSQPWLNLQTLLLGSPALLGEYPQDELEAARRAFERVRAAYLDRDGSDRPEQFAAAMERLAAAVRTLGEEIEPLRRQLDIPGDQEDVADMLAATAYPPVGYTDVELYYNRLDPFFWTWLVCLVAAVCLVLSLWLARRVLFWAGTVLLTLGLALIVYGLTLRTIITAWVSVTNSFEVTMLVGLTAGMLGLWLTLWPLLGPGVGKAWRMTALSAVLRCLPLGRAEGPAGDAPQAAAGRQPQSASGNGGRVVTFAFLLLLRAALTAGAFVALTVMPYGSGGARPIINLRPSVHSTLSAAAASELLSWAAGVGVLVLIVWWLPRLILAAVLSVATVPASCRRGEGGPLLQEVYRHKLSAVIGAAAALLATVLANFVPIFDKDIRALMPIIRDNFWLTVHVSSITASYGAAVLAWGLGLVALGYYLFGRYRDPQPGAAVAGASPAARAASTGRRPPEACALLAGPVYRAIQVTVWLLTVGTILGALWGDVAWGRFWAWDPKEVWALISLLVYLAVLHARYGGFSGNFGLAFASLLGTTSIVMAWYGVNYVLRSGLHTYAGGSGGLWYVVSVVLANWLFLAAAAVRYLVETQTDAATT